MHLIKYEQSGFILETASGSRLAWDIGNKTPVDKLDGVEPVDSFIVSHVHGDHFSPDHIRKLSPKTLYVNSECLSALESLPPIAASVELIEADLEGKIGQIDVRYFSVDHGPKYPVENLGFLLRADNKVVYFAGDMFHPSGLPPESLEVDYALIPVGAPNTFGPSDAFAFAKRFKHIRRLVPIHYEKNPAQKEEFVALAEGSFVVD